MRRRWAPYALALWTVVVWGTRLRNADGAAVAVAGSSVFLLLAVVVLVTRGHPAPTVALGTLTITVWLVRVPMIVLLSERGGAFKAVHAVLGVVSMALSAAACAGVAAARRGLLSRGRRPSPA